MSDVPATKLTKNASCKETETPPGSGRTMMGGRQCCDECLKSPVAYIITWGRQRKSVTGMRNSRAVRRAELRDECYTCSELAMLFRQISEIFGRDENQLEIFASTYSQYIGVCEAGPLPYTGNHIGNFYCPGYTTGEPLPSESENHLESILRTVRAPADYANVLKWFNKCRLGHTDSCGRAGGTEFPLRVIDCATRSLRTIPPKSHYMCLSYVWGSSTSYAQLSGDDLPEELPRTVADAIKVALIFEVPYLWVDRYCIDQQNAEEKHGLIRNMDKIYRNAALTIVAAAGEDPDYGLPRVGNTYRRKPTITTESLTFVHWENPIAEIMGSTWRRRGWTCQEMLLSSRCLYFADSQMVGVCKEDCYAEYELDPRYVSLFLSSSRLNDMSVRGLHAALQEYHSRSLTFMSDTLDAFEGIFNAFREIDGIPQHFSYFWGIPVYLWTDRETLAAGLLWHVRRKRTKPWPPEPLERCTDFPSWSWAAHKVDTKGCANLGLDLDAIKISNRDLRATDEKGCGVFIEVTRRREGAVVDLWTYIQLQDHYLDYLPHLDVHCWCIGGEIGMEGGSGHGHLSFLTKDRESPGALGTLRLDFAGSFEILGRELLAIYVESNDPRSVTSQDEWFPYYYLVEPVEHGVYRRFGHIWPHQEIPRGWELRKIRLI